jgi:hypothetical protein
MLFLLLAFSPRPRQIAAGLKSVSRSKTAFFIFWILVFTVAHLWNFRIAPWNGNGVFINSAVDLWFLKDYVIGHPFQAAWFYFYLPPIAHETLFQYYVWPWLYLFGYNLLAYEAALFVMWCVAYVFTLLLIDLFFRSSLITSIAALVFTFLPFQFIYTFVGYHYAMTVPLCVVSLYFLHVGFKTDSSFCLAMGGIVAGLCLASSLVGQQYVLALLAFVVLCAVFDRKCLKGGFNWRRVLTVIYGFAAGAMPILAYIVFNRHDYAYHNSPYWHSFLQAVRGHPSPNDLRYCVTQLWRLFFSVPGPRLFLGDVLPIPLPYYFLLLPGIVLALLKKRFEIVLLGTIPVVAAFISGGGVIEHRLLLAIPFWIILISFSLAGVLKLRPWPGVHIVVGALAGLILLRGLGPSIQYIYNTTKSHYLSMAHWRQGEVAVSRFGAGVAYGAGAPVACRGVVSPPDQ